MRSLVAVCDAHLVTMEEQRRVEVAAVRRRARYERYRSKCNRKIETCDADLAVSVSYDGSRLDVRVQNPLMHIPTDGSRFTTYEVAITTTNIAFTLPKSYVRRRYSEFIWLREWLTADHSDLVPPGLPPKTWWGGQFEPSVIEERLRGLRTFMQTVLLERVYLSNKALHLFVQTQLYTREIEDVLSGRDPHTVAHHIEQARKTCSSNARCVGCREEGDSESHDDQPDSMDQHAGPASACDIDSSSTSISDCDNGETPPVMSSTPQQTWNDSGLADYSIRTSSSESDESDKDSQSSEVPSRDCSVRPQQQHALRPVLSRSLPTGNTPLTPCAHRKRRVTFSMEVTVAKVVEEEGEGAKEDEVVGGSTIALVEVNANKDKMKGQ